MKKKGQLGNLQGIIVVLMIVGILLGAAFFILDEFITQARATDSVTVLEEVGYVNSTGYTLTGISAPGFNTPVITAIYNDSITLTAGNYTVSSSGVVTNASVITGINESDLWNINYTYLRGGNAYVAINSTIVAMLTIPNLLGLIVLIAVIGIILAVVFNVIPGARVQGA